MSISYSQVFVDAFINTIPAIPLYQEWQYFWPLLPYKWPNEIIVTEHNAQEIAEKYTQVGLDMGGLKDRDSTPLRNGLVHTLTPHINNIREKLAALQNPERIKGLTFRVKISSDLPPEPGYETRGLPGLSPAIVYTPKKQKATEQPANQTQSPRAQDSTAFHLNSFARHMAHLKRYDPLKRLASQTVVATINLATWWIGWRMAEGTLIGRALPIFATGLVIQYPITLLHTYLLRRQEEQAVELAKKDSTLNTSRTILFKDA